MADINLPYVNAYGNVTKVLQGIQKASTPDRFTQDFLATKLGLKGGSAKPVIPFLKKTGFLGSDGSPTPLYKRFRNAGSAGQAAAEALRKGFGPLYEINEYVHDLNDTDLRGVIMQATGLEEGSQTARTIQASFKALRAFAKFDGAEDLNVQDERANEQQDQGRDDDRTLGRLNLGYTINLNLPATSDVAVFNAIFKSLREHLLP